MTTYDTLMLAVDDGVATLTLNRPEVRNAIDARMAQDLVNALAALEAQPEVRALVLQGAGGHFCAGGDVRAMNAAGPRTPAQARAGMARYAKLTRALRTFDRPVIAAVDGIAFGAGLSLALLADLVLLGQAARLAMVFGRVGLVPDCGALYTLPRLVGLQRAKELVLSAREFGADEALRLGLALEVLPSDMLLPRAQALARSFCSASPLALALAKKALDQSPDADFEAMLELEATYQGMALTSDYHLEAVRRFVAKEPSLFRPR
ncbi:MAG TPA: enoyl-CoA hydratase/isomerase family protein [Ramlibacter sp.]|nr:enoyl-CoA hydratase/isomerase family protein [Ramlibacter sp.]